jgi:mono/diheme cytochrome c family protein
VGVRGRIRGFVENPVVSTRAFKAFLVTVLALAIVIPLALVAVPYIDFFNDMAVQYKVKAQMTWKVQDGVSLPADFPAVDGTLPRGFDPYPFPLTRGRDPAETKRLEAETATAAGLALTAGGPDIPESYRRPAPTLEILKTGRKAFESTCIVCHGPWAFGDGTVPQRGFPTPPSLQERKARDYPDGRFFHVITSGQNGIMPSYAYRFTPAERWAIVYYVRALQAGFPAPEVTR